MATELTEVVVTSNNAEQTQLTSNNEKSNSCSSSRIIRQTLTIKRTLKDDIFGLVFSSWAHNKTSPRNSRCWCCAILFVLTVQCLAIIGLIGGYEAENISPGVVGYEFVMEDGMISRNYLYDEWDEDLFVIHDGFIHLREVYTRPGGNAAKGTWIFGLVVSVMILFVYIAQESYGHILLFFTPDYNRTFFGNKTIIKVVSAVNIILVYLSWILGIRYVYYYADDAQPSEVILVPIGIVFILEIDEWAAKLFMLQGHGDINLLDIKTEREHIKICKIGWICFLANCAIPVILYPFVVWRINVSGMFLGIGDQPTSDTFVNGEFAYICYGSIVVSLICWLLLKKNVSSLQCCVCCSVLQ